MNYYETLYIVHSALEAGRLKDIVLSVETLLKEHNGEVLTTEVWGKKKLGYFIDKQKYGTYILVQFKSDGSKNDSFNKELEHNPGILAYMTVRIEEDGLIEQKDDLDTQIAGKESKNSNSKDQNDQPQNKINEGSGEGENQNTNEKEKESNDDQNPLKDQEEPVEEKVEE